MIFTEYPTTPRADWSAILVLNGGSINPPMYLGPSGNTPAPGAPGVSNTDVLYDGIRLLGNNNMTSAVIATSPSEIKGYNGASIRGIGAWVTHINGPLKLASRMGYVASNWPSDNVYGYKHSDALPGIISGVRLHTDIYFSGVYFNGNRNMGYVGVVTGTPDKPHELDYSRSGGHQVYFKNVIWEHFANYAFRITGSLCSMIDCAFEEVGATEQGVGWFQTVQSVFISNPRFNLTGAAVADSTGASVKPLLPNLYKINSVQSFKHDGGYYHNTNNISLFADNEATIFDVLPPRADANKFHSTLSAMYTPNGRATSSGYNKAMKIGSIYLWTTPEGEIRISKTNPTANTDGTVLGTAT